MNQKEIDKLKEVRHLAEELIARYCPTFKFDFDNAKRRLGCCRYRHKKITISTFHALNQSMEVIRDVILHEIAHAMLPITEYHGWRWKKQARDIGCTATRLFDTEIRPPNKYKTVCPNCGKIRFTLRRRKDLACGKCCDKYNGGKWNEKYILKWEKLA